MAKVKFSALISEMRNKLNGSVFSRNRSGNYLRNKVTPLNPSTSYQTATRNMFAGVAQAWRALTAAQRLSWNNAVSNFVGTDIFGDSVTPSGFQLHQQINMNLSVVEQSVLTTPPTPGDVNYFTSFSAAAANGAQTVTLTFAPAIDVDDSVIVYGTPALSPGKYFAKSELRKFDVLTSADVSPFSIETEYIAKFGAVGAEGQKIFFAMKVVENATGLAGTLISTSAVIAA